MTDIQRIRGLAEDAWRCSQDLHSCRCPSADFDECSERLAALTAQLAGELSDPATVLRLLAVVEAADGIGDDHHSKDCRVMFGKPCDCGVAEAIDAVADLKGEAGDG